MDKGTKIYQEIIDELVKKSKICVTANWVINGEAKGTGEHITKLNELFAKLTPAERGRIEIILSCRRLAILRGGIYEARV